MLGWADAASKIKKLISMGLPTSLLCITGRTESAANLFWSRKASANAVVPLEAFQLCVNLKKYFRKRRLLRTPYVSGRIQAMMLAREPCLVLLHTAIPKKAKKFYLFFVAKILFQKAKKRNPGDSTVSTRRLPFAFAADFFIVISFLL